MLPGTSSTKTGQDMFLWENLKELDCVAKEAISPRDVKKKWESILLGMPEWMSSSEVLWRALLGSGLYNLKNTEESHISYYLCLVVPLWISLRLGCPKLPVGHDWTNKSGFRWYTLEVDCD